MVICPSKFSEQLQLSAHYNEVSVEKQILEFIFYRFDNEVFSAYFLLK